jgi:S-adenosylmethionine uptake transporter
MLCIIKAYRSGEAAVVAPMHYSQMLWAALYGIVLFQEFPDRMTMLGSAVIVLSGLYLLLRERRRKDSSQKPVLSTRSRMDIGITPRISLLLKRRS